jgi:hypothetical protein
MSPGRKLWRWLQKKSEPRRGEMSVHPDLHVAPMELKNKNIHYPVLTHGATNIPLLRSSMRVLSNVCV